MLRNWPSNKEEAYKYTDLSKADGLELAESTIRTTVDCGLCRSDDEWVIESNNQYQLTHTLPAARTSSSHTLTVKRGAHATLIETIQSESVGVAAAHQQLTIVLEDGAQLIHLRHQRCHASSFHWGQTQVKLERDAHYTQIAPTTGSALSRHDLNVQARGSGAGFTLRALQLLGAGQQGDLTTCVQHEVAHTQSDQLVKTVLTGNAHGVYQGKIIVTPHAQKTNAQQQSRALLLGDQAEMNTKPELEIFADDVTCSHGAATGDLDPVQLFYLQSRGLTLNAARSLLIEGFTTDVLAGYPALEEEATRWLTQL